MKKTNKQSTYCNGQKKRNIYCRLWNQLVISNFKNERHIKGASKSYALSNVGTTTTTADSLIYYYLFVLPVNYVDEGGSVFVVGQSVTELRRHNNRNQLDSV